MSSSIEDLDKSTKIINNHYLKTYLKKQLLTQLTRNKKLHICQASKEVLGEKRYMSYILFMFI